MTGKVSLVLRFILYSPHLHTCESKFKYQCMPVCMYTLHVSVHMHVCNTCVHMYRMCHHAAVHCTLLKECACTDREVK